MQLASLYRCAQRNHIPVLRYPLPRCSSLSVQTEQGCVIGMDKLICDNAAQERTHLSHELGHCLTGSFYTTDSDVALRRRCEERADRWAIRRLVPLEALKHALARGMTQPHELAEYFGVPEPFLQKCVQYYKEACGAL